METCDAIPLLLSALNSIMYFIFFSVQQGSWSLVVSTVIWICTTIPKVILASASKTASPRYELFAVPIEEV
jgi:hypothetical protein